MKRLKAATVIALYVATLLWAYVAIISPGFAYYGYNLYWPETPQLVWIYVLSLTPMTYLPLTLSRPSGLILWWLYVTVYIPSILLPTLSLTLTPAKLLPLEVSLLLGITILSLVSTGKVLSVPRLRIRPKFFWPAVFLVWASCLAFVAAHFNPSTLLLNLASLFLGGTEYTIRSGFFDQLSQAGRGLGYAIGQIGDAVDPFLISYGLVYGRKRLLLAGIAGQLIIFAVVGAKSDLYSTLFLVLVFFMLRRLRKNFGLALSSLLLAVVVFAAGADLLTDNVAFSSITTRRTLMDPGLLTGFYYEHYSETSKAGLAYHFPQGGEAVPAPSFEIGLVYFGDEHVDANANLWAEGFADFGFSGIAIFTVLLAGMMWLYDSVAARQNRELGILLVAMQAFSFSNAAPLTTLITHGGIMAALLLWCAPAPPPGELEPEDAECEAGMDPELAVAIR